jgi:hypothetical protein
MARLLGDADAHYQFEQSNQEQRRRIYEQQNRIVAKKKVGRMLSNDLCELEQLCLIKILGLEAHYFPMLSCT